MPSRRTVLTWLSGLCVSLGGLLVAVPGVALLTSGRREDAAPLLPVGDLDRLPEGEPVRRAVIAPRLRDAWKVLTGVPLGAVWLVRSGQAVRALSTVCPHAGCAVDFDAERACFACPCHGSVFSLAGERLTGPSLRPMDELPCRVQGGQVLVAYRRFRQGVVDQEPLA